MSIDPHEQSSSVPILSCRNVSVRFGGLAALSNVDVDVHEREIVGIIGPNGAGKTTLMNAISCFVKVQPGTSIKVREHEVIGMAASSLTGLGVARTFQTLELSPRDSLLDNVLVGSHTRRRGSFTETCLVTEACEYLESLGIAGWAESPVESLPYAVRKRAELARALMTEPQLILLDEPGSGISSVEKGKLRELIKTVRDEKGIAFLVIEHDVGFLTDISDRMIALNFGRAIATGTPSEIVRDRDVIDAYIGTDAS